MATRRLSHRHPLLIAALPVLVVASVALLIATAPGSPTAPRLQAAADGNTQIARAGK
jgi:hypothetical protein